MVIIVLLLKTKNGVKVSLLEVLAIKVEKYHFQMENNIFLIR